MPLIYEFSKSFFKNDVSKYCNKNDIAYIYEKDFNTEWFRCNRFTNDGRHPNAEGAKLIAERIKQVL
jgi:lysophospholipase L1-like esterase